MRKTVRLLFILLVIGLLATAPVNASFWSWFDDIFKGTSKVDDATKASSKAAKVSKYGKASVKTYSNLEKTAITETEKKQVINNLFDRYKNPHEKLLEEQEQLRLNKNKPKTLEERIVANKALGEAWENSVKEVLCKNSLCVTKMSDVKIVNTYKDYKVVITGGVNTRSFINSNKEKIFENTWDVKRRNFNKMPDFLEITMRNNQINEIKIIDAKTSSEATRTAQDTEFKEICKLAKVKCGVEYIIPPEKMSNGDLICGGVAILTTGVTLFGSGGATAPTALVIAEGVDYFCLVMAFSN